jgi:hypothetical protein
LGRIPDHAIAVHPYFHSKFYDCFEVVPKIGIFGLNLLNMAKNTSILLSDYFDKLINELKKGENSGFIKDFDRTSFLKKIHKKYSTRPK